MVGIHFPVWAPVVSEPLKHCPPYQMADMCYTALALPVLACDDWLRVPGKLALVAHGCRGFFIAAAARQRVGKILKGAKPADFPIQLSTNVEIVINLKPLTPSALGGLRWTRAAGSGEAAITKAQGTSSLHRSKSRG